MRATPAVAVLIAIAVVAAVGARSVMQDSYSRLQHWAKYGAGPVTGPGPAARAISGIVSAPASGKPRVLLLLVDGLRADDLPRLPMLERLARTGVYLTATVPEPAWPAPAWATALTSLPPAEHGVLLAESPAPLPPPHLLSVVREAGFSVAAAGGTPFLALVGPYLNSGAYSIPSGWEGTGAALLTAVKAALTSGADFVVVHLEGLHTVAHRLVGRNISSAAGGQVTWEDGLGWTDARITQLVEGLNLNQTVLVVTGTYAVGADGRHGASRPVPIILNGPGLGYTATAVADLRSVAPTVAALFGQDWPGQAGSAQARPAGTTDYLLRWWQQTSSGLPWVAGIGLLLCLYVVLTIRKAFSKYLWTAIGLYFLLWNVAFWLGGGQLSPDLTGLESPDTAFWHQRVLEVIAAMAPAMAVLGWQLGRHGILVAQHPRGPRRLTQSPLPARPRPVRPGHAVRIAVHATLVIMGLMVLQATALVLVTGWEQKVSWPGSSWVVKYFLDLGQATILGFTAPLWAVIALLTAAMGRAARDPDEPPLPEPQQYPTAGDAVPPRLGRPGAPIIPIAPHRRR